MILHSTHIECVKIGLEILELYRYGDKICEVVRRLGCYDEFTIFSIWNMRKWEHGNDEIFALAKKVEGWGRIHAVDLLEPSSDEIRQWLLIEGTKNTVLNSYSSLTCWTKSDAEKILKHPTQKEFDGISLLIEGMLEEEPVKGISGLENAQQILLHYLSISSNYGHSTAFYKLVMSIKTWAEKNQYPSITEACDDILHSPECMDAVHNEPEDFDHIDDLLMN